MSKAQYLQEGGFRGSMSAAEGTETDDAEEYFPDESHYKRFSLVRLLDDR